jgi:hypothetical protein
MSTFKREANFHSDEPPLYGPFSAGDAFYEALMKAHDGLTDEQSQLFNAKLILLLANQVGDVKVLLQAIELAKADAPA